MSLKKSQSQKQIWWKVCFTVICILEVRWLQNFAHAMTAQLSWHVQNLVAATWSNIDWEQNDISIKFELQWKIFSVMNPSEIICQEL